MTLIRVYIIVIYVLSAVTNILQMSADFARPKCSVRTRGCLGAEVEVEPREVLVLPNHNVTALCRLNAPLQYCRVEIPGMMPLNLNAKLSDSEVSYYGNGLKSGECGFTIRQVQNKHNGPVKCALGVETQLAEATGIVHLIVAKAPQIPELDLSRGTDSVTVYKVNDKLHASCIVKNGRPVANISWFLDDEPLYRDGLSMPTVLDMAKENLQTKIQNLTRILQASDNGKHLRCVAYHPAYPKGKEETQRLLDVKYAPLPQGELDKFGYTIGQPGAISVIVESNPKPMVEWDIGDERIKENQNDQTGRIKAEAIKELGNGRYEVTLWIAAINKHDTEKIYVLRTYNDMGQQDYNIKISTSPEPEGLELGIGGIIGIVIAVLFIFLLIFLLIFAKVTGRWCFSDGATVIDYTTGDSSHHVTVDGISGDGVDNPHHQVSQEYINGSPDTRNLGESSDTESTDVRPKDTRNFPPIKLTSFFKKNKDKVASTEDVEPKKLDDDVKMPLEAPPEEEPKGLVYAELDLVSPTNVKPIVKNDDDKTEYAEIVYTPTESDKNT